MTPYNIPIIREESKSDKHDEHFIQQRDLAERINRTVKENNDNYLESNGP